MTVSYPNLCYKGTALNQDLMSWLVSYLQIILTHLAFRANAKKRVISNKNVTVLKALGKRALADINGYCKMTLVMALDKVTSFLCLNDVTNTCKCMRCSPTIGGISSV